MEEPLTIHRFLKTLTTTAILVASLAASTACAAAAPRGRVYVRVGPPAPIVERRIVAPGPGYVWISGYHTWDSRAYVWVPGRWDRPPRARANWVPARWVHDRRNGWYLVEGHWR
jgi:WXXGXW repeat (2 copies)